MTDSDLERRTDLSIRRGMNAFREWSAGDGSMPVHDVQILLDLALAFAACLFDAIGSGRISEANPLFSAFLIAAYNLGRASGRSEQRENKGDETP